VPSTNCTLTGTDRPSALSTGVALKESDDALDRSTIAELSSKQISQMSAAELARVIRAGPLPTVHARPEYLDRATQERLAYLARLCCRHREHWAPTVDSPSKRKGRDAPRF
jgi:hypothetical protein